MVPAFGRFASWLPPLIALAELIDLEALLRRSRSELAFPLLLMVVLGPVIAFGLPGRGLRMAQRIERAALTSCLLAPLAVFGSWAVMPGGGFYGTADFRTFLHWLTRYPNWGPINIEVLAGMSCVIGASFVPWLLAQRLLFVSPPRALWLDALLGAQLLAYGPLLWELDVWQLWLGSQLFGELPELGAPYLAGASARLFATASMIALWKMRRGSES